MFYCQKQYKLPRYIDNKLLLFMCPFGRQNLLVEKDENLANIYTQGEVLDKVESSIIEVCKKNCTLCEELRNNKDIIDAVIKCTDYVCDVLEMCNIPNHQTGKFVGEACENLLFAKNQMKTWHDDQERR